MGILSYGSSTADVESALQLKTAVSASTAEGKAILMLVRGIEAWVKLRINRNFKRAEYDRQEHEVDHDQPVLFLSDYPATLDKVEQVLGWNSDGTVSGVYQYQLNEVRLINRPPAAFVVMLAPDIAAAFPAGPSAVLATYQAGYSTAELSTGTLDEVAMMKNLLLSILQREYKLSSAQLRHTENIGFAGESAGIKYSLTTLEEQMLSMLTAHNP